MNSMIERVDDDALAGGPVVSMRVVTAAEDAVFPDFPDGLKPELQTELGRIYASLGAELGMIRDLVGTAKDSLNVEDYGDALAGAFARLSVCIGCVEGLRRLGDLETAAPETGRRGDLEMGEQVFVCPGCGEAVGRFELGSVTDRDGHWHGQCEQRAWDEQMEALKAENRGMREVLATRAGVLMGDLSAALSAEVARMEGGAV